MSGRKLMTALIAVLLVMVPGCGSDKDFCEKQGEKAIAHISKKYQREFVPVPDDTGAYIRELGKLTCRTEGMDESEYVTITIDGNGFHDNYFGYIIRTEVESYVKNMVTPVFPECKVFYDVGANPFPDDLIQGNTLSDYYERESDARLVVTVYAKAGEGQYADKISKIEDTIISTGHAYMFRVFVLKEKPYGKIERNNQDDFWVENDKAKQNGNPLCVYEYEKLFVNGEVL